MNRALAIAVAGLLALAPSAQARRCAPRHGEHTIARSARAVLLQRGANVVTGCSLHSGRRRELLHFVDDPGSTGDSSDTLLRIVLRGTRVASIVRYADRYDSSYKLEVQDAIQAGESKVLFDQHERLGDVALGADGLVAYTTLGISARLWIADARTVRAVDEAATIDRLGFAGHLLSWRHDGVQTSAPVPIDDPCPAALSLATLTLDYAVDEVAHTITACWRATGAVRTLSGVTGRDLDVRGEWIAAATSDDRIVTLDVANGATASIDAPGRGAVLVDPRGSVVWTRWRTDPPFTDGGALWVHDAAGTRELDPAMPWPAVVWLDASILHWGLDPNAHTAVLTP